jgi:hypothetical protein
MCKTFQEQSYYALLHFLTLWQTLALPAITWPRK